MMLRAAWKTLRKSWLMNSITVLQLTAALLAVSMTVSSVWLRYRKYLPFQDWFQSQGILCEYRGFAYLGDITSNDGFVALNSENFDFLSAPVDTMGAYAMWFTPDETASTNGKQKSGSGIHLQNYCFDDEIFRRYLPDLAEGTWPDPSHRGDAIEACVTYNDGSFRVGDELHFHISMIEDDSETPRDYPLTVRIVGMLADGADIPAAPGGNYHEERGNTFQRFYLSWFQESSDYAAIMYPLSQLMDGVKASETFPQKTAFGNGKLLLRYREPVTAEQIEKDRVALAQTGVLDTRSLEELDKNSQAWLWRQLYDMLPIILMLMILVSVSAISITALSTRRRLRDYAVYALSGIPWRRCILINLLQSLMTAACAAVLALGCGIVISHTSLREAFYLHFTVWLLPAGGAVLLIYLAVSLLMPWLMLHRSSVREILKSN